MTKSANPLRWDDAVVERCLRAKDHAELRAICDETGLSINVARSWRTRRQQRAIKLAAKLGLLPPVDPRSFWDSSGVARTS